MASMSISPVRTRRSEPIETFQILPSPILPVLAASAITPIEVVGGLGGDDDLQLDLRQEVDRVLRAAEVLGLAALTAEATNLGDGHAFDTVGEQRFFHVVELVRLDDGSDELEHDLEPLTHVCGFRMVGR